MLRYFIVVMVLVLGTEARVFTRCQLAQELIRQGFARKDIPQWVCLVESESSRNTAAKGGPNSNGSYDYGIFQINSRYWCDLGANDCKIKCSNLLNDNISDDSTCAKLIFKRHGFNAWYGWINKCKGKDVSAYVKGCQY